MFIESRELLERIREVSAEISKKTEGRAVFEEFIALPYYGNIILRFDLKESVGTLEELDRYESMMYDVVKDEFLIDFMGNVYRDAGLDYRHFDDLLRTAYEKYRGEEIHKSKYDDLLRKDAMELLSLCGLDTELPVWEIQPEEEILLLIMAPEAGEPIRYEVDGKTVIVAETEERCCEGIMKAAFYAKRNRKSLVRAELEL